MAGKSEAATLKRQRPFVLFWLARLTSTFGYQMLTVVIGWKLYELTGSAFDLGLLGLIQFVPAVVLTLLIGHVADRYDRRWIIRLAQCVHVAGAGTLMVALNRNALTRELLFGIVFLLGCARAFELPTSHALAPSLVPPSLIARAVAAWASANQTAVICGPALGGLIYTFSPVLVCALCVLFFVASIALISFVSVQRKAPPDRQPPTVGSVLAGIHFIRTRPRLLGVITLDLFVIILGGVTALLPIYARDILAVGPFGLGLLRSAPAVGALLTTIFLAHHPIERRVGPLLFAVVCLFGLGTMIFAVSPWFPLSLVTLALMGASDSISVVIRFSLVQIETPDAMRGRVSAINYLFVGSSNTLGEFESGTVAALFGAVTSAFIGGLGSVAMALLWMRLFPQLRKIDRFKPAK